MIPKHEYSAETLLLDWLLVLEQHIETHDCGVSQSRGRQLLVERPMRRHKFYLCQLRGAKQICSTRCERCLAAWLLALLGLVRYSNPV